MADQDEPDDVQEHAQLRLLVQGVAALTLHNKNALQKCLKTQLTL